MLMPAKSKLTPEQWTQVYATWQVDPRPALAWLVDELALPISRQGIADRARRDGWTKGGIPSGQPAHELKDKPVRADKADAAVEESLYRLATGFTYEEEHVCVIGGEIVKTMVLRYCPPNLQAQRLWLQSRQPNRWPKCKDDAPGQSGSDLA